MKTRWTLTSLFSICALAVGGIALSAPANAASPTPAAQCAANYTYEPNRNLAWGSFDKPGGTKQGVTVQLSQGMWAGYCLVNGPYAMIFQGDGNLVLYKNSAAIWSSQTNNRGAQRLVLQPDGNIVIYTATNKVLWQSRGNVLNAVDPNLNYTLEVQGDGNLVESAFDAQSPVHGVVWASYTQGK